MTQHAVFAALAAALGLDPESPEASALIRRAYVNPSPARPGPEENAVYWHLIPDGSPPPLREDLPGEGFRFVPLRLNLVFYGAGAESMAWRVWRRIFEDGPGAPRRILRETGLFPVPRPEAPLPVWEEAGKEHRPRTDLSLRVWAAVSEPDPQPAAVGTAPEVVLHRRP